MDTRETSFALCETVGVSGDETETIKTVSKMLEEYCAEVNVSEGGVTGWLREYDSSLPKLVLDAHIDQIGMIVNYITEEGFVKFSAVGGIDRRLLPAQPVVIHGKKKIKGVICSVPPHLTNSDSKVTEIDSLSIDTGLTADELKKNVSLGDRISFDVKCRELLNSRVTGGAMDDRCGIVAILRTLELLKDRELKYNVIAVFSCQEEIGERGAKVLACEISPDTAIAVDVTFGYTQGENRKKCGILGQGAMIGISPSLSRNISEELINIAKSENIPCQVEVMEGLTSTNADRYSVNQDGVDTCTVSIPLRSMHTPVEVIDLNDIEYTASLLAEFAAK